MTTTTTNTTTNNPDARNRAAESRMNADAFIRWCARMREATPAHTLYEADAVRRDAEIRRLVRSMV